MLLLSSLRENATDRDWALFFQDTIRLNSAFRLPTFQGWIGQWRLPGATPALPGGDSFWQNDVVAGALVSWYHSAPIILPDFLDT